MQFSERLRCQEEDHPLSRPSCVIAKLQGISWGPSKLRLLIPGLKNLHWMRVHWKPLTHESELFTCPQHPTTVPRLHHLVTVLLRQPGPASKLRQLRWPFQVQADINLKDCNVILLMHLANIYFRLCQQTSPRDWEEKKWDNHQFYGFHYVVNHEKNLKTVKSYLEFDSWGREMGCNI